MRSIKRMVDRHFRTAIHPEPMHAAKITSVPTELRWVEDYAGVHRARVECATPCSEDQLRTALRWARNEGRTVTLRGGGQCLHGQSVGDDLVIDLSAFNRVSVDARTGIMTAGAGARWADVHAALPSGWVLPNLVSTGAASVGGTLMADAASRFSSAFGREADGVRRVRLMTAEGAIVQCDREGPQAELFGALPGSVGLLGVLVSVEHALVDVRHLLADDGSMRVKTIVRKHPNARSLIDDLAMELRAPRSQQCPRGAYALLVPGCGALLFHSTYTCEPRGRRMPNHRRRNPLRAIVERLLHVPALNRAISGTVHALLQDGDQFVDDADDFAFFMDTGTTARRYAARLGLWDPPVQQVLELPFDASVTACAAASALLDGCERLCRAYKIQPLVWDVLAIRGDAGRHALRFTTAVALRRLADDGARALLAAQATLAARFGAKVLRGKGVFADTDTLAATTGEELAQLRRLKEQWDSSGLFGGPFYREVLLPAIRRATGARPEAANTH